MGGKYVNPMTFTGLVGLAALASVLSFERALRAQDPAGDSSSGPSPILSAVVDAGGTLVRGNGVSSARKLGVPGQNTPGLYEVVFTSEVRNGTFVAAIGHSANQVEPFGLISVAQRKGNPNGVFVETADTRGSPADRGFHLIVLPTADSTTGPIGGGPAPTQKIVNVAVHRHPSVPLTDDDADRILAEMSTVLQTKDQINDVPTSILYRRDGAVQLLPSNVPGAIQTPDEQAAAFAVPGIKVVRDISYCDGPGETIIGCAPVGSPVVNEIVVRFTEAQQQEGILWAHENGHNAGLDHREDDQNAIMHPVILGNHRVVNSPESLKYLSGPAAAHGRAMAARRDPAGSAQGGSAQPAQPDNPLRPRDVREFVQRHYAEGVPYAIASTYTAEDADVLLKMLEKPKENDEFLPEIVCTLAYIGSEKALEPLIKFAKDPPSTPRAFKAQKAALMHLGDLVAKLRAHRGAAPANTAAAVELMSTVASAPANARAMSAPRARAAQATSPQGVTPPSPDELAAELSVAATWGLGLSGTQQAQAALQSLGAQNSPAFAPAKRVAEAAVKVNQEVRTKGLQRYHAEKARHGSGR